MEINPITRKELAAHFGVSLRTVTMWHKAGCPVMIIGKQTAFTHGTRVRYDLDAVKKWLKTRRPNAKAPAAAGKGVEQ